MGTVQEKEETLRQLSQLFNKLSREPREDFLTTLLEALSVSVNDSLSFMLSREEISEMRGYGIDFGAHTASHPNLALIPRAEARWEITASREELERALNSHVKHFAFPNPGASIPHYTGELARMVKDAGYESGSTSQTGIIENNCNVNTLPRIGLVGSNASIEQAIWKIGRTR